MHRYAKPALQHYLPKLQPLQLGLLNSQQQFQPAPLSLTPWQLSPLCWQQAQQLGRLFGRLLLAAGNDEAWLRQALQGLPKNNLFAQLAALPQAFSRSLAPVALMRHDFLLDCSGQWRWVESNTIAAGMGPLNQQLGRLLSTRHNALADNPALQQQAQTLYAAAYTLRQQYDNNAPLLLFVVEPNEDNLFDQQLLQQAIAQLGGRVRRLTLAQLEQAQLNHSNRLQLPDGQEADLLYYRTGYNLADYTTPAQLVLRARLQQAALLQCPDITLQLAGSKWVQAKLSNLLLSGQHETLHRWGFSPADCARLKQAIMPMYPLTPANKTQALQDIASGWLLKSQQEGGGGIWRGQQAIQQLSLSGDNSTGLLLMAPITPYVRTEPVWLLRQGKLSCQYATVSELGIFSAGDSSDYAGYLLRSKPAAELAGGVHGGSAVIDTLVLRSPCCNRTYKSQQFGYDRPFINSALRKDHDHGIIRRPARADVCCIKY